MAEIIDAFKEVNIELFGGTAIEITADDYRGIMGKTGLVYLKSLDCTINTSGVKQVVDKKTYEIDKHMERQMTQKEGVLHDGTHVIKKFGSWYLLYGDYDEKGNPTSLAAPDWCPEVARDLCQRRLNTTRNTRTCRSRNA